MDKNRTLKLNKEFKRVYYKGKFKAHPILVTYLLKTKNNKTRIGITASKKIGNAVVRNRARRVIRSAYYSLRKEDKIPLGFDIVLVARKETAAKKSYEIAAIMKKQFDAVLKKDIKEK